MAALNRVAFLVDGFNLYHSLKSLAKKENVGAKWLDIKGLCESYLHLLDGNAQNVGVYYFSALATHLKKFDQDMVKRHQNYLMCLTDSGVANQMARFKKKSVYCPNCKRYITRYEEKETDVAISVKVLELFVQDACDSIVLLTGDTDLAPAVRTANSLFPKKQIYFLFPYDRSRNELAKLAKKSFQISKASVLKNQFQDPYKCQTGILVSKPLDW